jgi:hypothetical protein
VTEGRVEAMTVLPLGWMVSSIPLSLKGSCGLGNGRVNPLQKSKLLLLVLSLACSRPGAAAGTLFKIG